METASKGSGCCPGTAGPSLQGSPELSPPPRSTNGNPPRAPISRGGAGGGHPPPGGTAQGSPDPRCWGRASSGLPRNGARAPPQPPLRCPGSRPALEAAKQSYGNAQKYWDCTPRAAGVVRGSRGKGRAAPGHSWQPEQRGNRVPVWGRRLQLRGHGQIQAAQPRSSPKALGDGSMAKLQQLGKQNQPKSPRQPPFRSSCTFGKKKKPAGSSKPAGKA